MTATRALAGIAGIVLLLAACGSGREGAVGVAAPSTESEAAGPEVASAPVGVSVTEASALLSGFPPGVRERFEPFAEVGELADRVDATVSARFREFTLNPERGDGPDLYVPGYAGSAGVLRIFFEVERSLAGTSARLAEAPGRPGEGLIAVDLPYFIPAPYQAEHIEQLGALEGATFLLFLLDGTIDNERTGAYHLWDDPFAAFAVDPDGTTIRVVHDTDLVSRDAVLRGAQEHPEGSIPLEDYDPATEYGRRFPDLLSSLEGRPVDEVLAELQRDQAPALPEPDATMTE